QAVIGGPLPLIRQMQLTVGSMILVFSLLAVFISPWFGIASAFAGIGLLSAGITGNCAAVNLLTKAPWNRANPGLKQSYCQAAGNCD
ncbi:MAG: DUF2892 domain-containing protein, partial [Gammaproteobacteria bacterium]|nr:DUF2892 domain-containing protein [Gammaproteobacteria bacterium]